MNTDEKRKHPILILVRGMPGSGKSYLADAFQKSLRELVGASEVVMLDPDATDYGSQEYAEHVKTSIAEGVDAKLHAYRFLRTKAYQGIADHKVIIWNQPFTNVEIFHKMVANLQNQAAEHNTSLPILIVEVEVDPATAKARVLKRKQAGGHGPSDKTLAQRIRDYKSYGDEGFETVTVQGEGDVAVSVAAVLKALREL